MSSIDWNLGPSMLIAGGGVQTAVTKETVIETLKEFNDITSDRPVTTDEFNDAIAGILRSMPSQFETQYQIISQLTRLVAFDLPDDYFVEFPRTLNGLEMEEVLSAAVNHIDTRNLNIVIVGDASVISPGLEELGLSVVEIDYEGRRV
jgi:predicted Zn-dependent peptidase